MKQIDQLELKVHPRYRGQRVTAGTERWKKSFFDYAWHLKQYFREYAAKLTEPERRELAVDMGLPVADRVEVSQ